MGQNYDGFLTDFSTGGDKAADATFNLNPSVPGTMERVGGSFPGIDSPYDLQKNNGMGQPATMDTVWGIKTQSSQIGNPGL